MRFGNGIGLYIPEKEAADMNLTLGSKYQLFYDSDNRNRAVLAREINFNPAEALEKLNSLDKKADVSVDTSLSTKEPKKRNGPRGICPEGEPQVLVVTEPIAGFSSKC